MVDLFQNLTDIDIWRSIDIDIDIPGESDECQNQKLRFLGGSFWRCTYKFYVWEKMFQVQIKTWSGNWKYQNWKSNLKIPKQFHSVSDSLQKSLLFTAAAVS